MKCSEKGCPFPARLDSLCAGHLRDRTLESSIVGGSSPLMQEYALVESVSARLPGNGSQRGGGAGHRGPYQYAEL
jgi:hypothetical protein